MKHGTQGLAVVGMLIGLSLATGPAWGQNRYEVHNLVSDGAVPADHTDGNLVNAWGLVFNPTGPAWVADNGTGVSTLYDGLGNPQPPPPATPLVVVIPPAPGTGEGGNPTGIVFNGTTGFAVSKGGVTAPARFLFAAENGTISGWAPTVDPTHAITAVDNSLSGTVYKGLALAGNGTGFLLYATDFHHAKVDVFDASFHPVTLPGAFSDPSIPPGFAPFGIQNILGDVYVTYAKQDAEAHDDVKGRGLGFVDVFDANGNLIRRVASRGPLNAPWGLALAPASFGKLGGRLLVGNFGDGTIHAYDLTTGNRAGTLRGVDGRPVQIDGLWGLQFGNGVLHQPASTLFFAAGPFDEMHGLYGRIDPVPGSRGHDDGDADGDD